jgi:hypothetical protein
MYRPRSGGLMALAAITEIGLSAIPIPRPGIEGAAIASATSLIGRNLAMAVLVRKSSRSCRTCSPGRDRSRFARQEPKDPCFCAFWVRWYLAPKRSALSGGLFVLPRAAFQALALAARKGSTSARSGLRDQNR